jgi:hypothetical protein
MYGVTMQEPGVSSIISATLDAEAVAPTPDLDAMTAAGEERREVTVAG